MIVCEANSHLKGDQSMLKISKEDILNALANGVKPEDIANSFTSVLNDAVKEQERAADQEKKKEGKLADSRILARSVASFMSKHYPELGIVTEAIPLLDGAELVRVFDDIAQSLSPILPTGSKSPNNKVSAAAPAIPFTTSRPKSALKNATTNLSDEDILRKFLKDMGW
jgi:hypothetical protein